MIHNLGTGVGYSVLDLVKAFEEANALTIPYKIAPRRPGDVTICYADPTKAKMSFDGEAKKTVVDMCRDAWNWQKTIQTDTTINLNSPPGIPRRAFISNLIIAVSKA